MREVLGHKAANTSPIAALAKLVVRLVGSEYKNLGYRTPQSNLAAALVCQHLLGKYGGRQCQFKNLKMHDDGALFCLAIFLKKLVYQRLAASHYPDPH